ncbi:hypothetical protein PG984_000093 [Apiospora sp. TS-2023a]
MAVRDGEWFQYDFDTDFFSLDLVLSGQNRQAERAMDVWVTATQLRGHKNGETVVTVHRGIGRHPEYEESWLMRKWVEVRKRLGTDSLDLEGDFGRLFFLQDHLQVYLVHWLLLAGARGDPDFLWVPSVDQLTLDGLERELPTRRLPRFRWKRMKFVSGLRDPKANSKERSAWLEIAVLVWSIYDAAMSGLNSLVEQRWSYVDPFSRDYAFSLQLALSEAIGMQDIKVIESLLEFGVDPNTSLLPNYETTDHDSCLNALPRAAGLHNPEILAMLIAKNANVVRLRPLALHVAVANARPLTKTGGARLWRTIETLLQPRAREVTADGNINSPLKLRTHTLHLIMRALGRLEVVGQISPLQYRAVLTRLFPTDTLRQAIRFSCSMAAVASLTSSGMGIDATRLDHGRTMLHDALFGRSIDRHSIVKLSLENRASPAVEGNGVSILEATLRSTATPDMSIESSTSEWHREQRKSLKLFEEFRENGAEIPPDARGLLSLLLIHKCPAFIVEEIVATISGRGQLDRKYSKLVVYCIALGRSTLAQWLIENGVDVKTGEYRKRYALWAACATNAPAWLLRILIKKGAMDEPSLAFLGRTPLQIAVSKGYMEVAKLLICHGALINTESRTLSGEPLRMTALDWAAAMGRLDMIQYLVKIGGCSACRGLTSFDGAFWHARSHIGALDFFKRHTQRSFSDVVSSLRKTSPDMMASDKDIIDLTRYEDWNTETDWDMDDWRAED